jgi:flagellar basal body-associated protein FliL
MDEEEDMNETEKKELALSKIVLIILAVLGLGVVVWLGWFAA